MSAFKVSAPILLRFHKAALTVGAGLLLAGCSETVDTTSPADSTIVDNTPENTQSDSTADPATKSTSDDDQTLADANPSDGTTTAVDIPEFSPEGHVMEELDSVRKHLENNEAVLIDVREQSEWDDGHLAIASLVPLSELKEDPVPEDVLAKLPRDKPIYLHCRSGGRVLMATEILKPKGFDVRPLKSGFDDLVAAGFEQEQ